MSVHDALELAVVVSIGLTMAWLVLGTVNSILAQVDAWARRRKRGPHAVVDSSPDPLQEYRG